MTEWLGTAFNVLGALGAWLLLMILGFGLLSAALAPFFIFRDADCLHRGLWESGRIGEWCIRLVISVIAALLFIFLFGSSWSALNSISCQVSDDPEACVEGY